MGKPATIKTTVKPTTTRTSKTTTTKPVTSKTTVKSSTSTTVRTTAKPTTGKTTTSVKTTTSFKPRTTTKTTTRATTTRTTSTTLVPPTTARTTAAPTTSTGRTDTTAASSSVTTTTAAETTTTPSPVLFDCFVSDPACGNMCGNVTSTTTGVVQSPDFPGNYENYNKKCYVIITAPAGWMIQLKFTDFNVETNVCSVYVADYVTYLLPPTSGNTIPALVPATTGSMEIGYEFSASSKTNTMTSGQRWQANFSVTSQGSSCSVQDPLACGNMCGDGTSIGTGVVQSPNFPADYGNKDRYCAVTIVVPAGKQIRLEFTTFNLDDNYGFIDVADTGSLYLSGATGSLTPAVVTTTSNIVYIFFSSHASSAFSVSTSIYNWRATYTAITEDTTGLGLGLHLP
ncbi:CUB and sushi domain-containing protein 2-like isoform X2 [Daphnia pulex]|nr:CUB and sushi domain-containing protein 2-like isoform X2 [Daphnia pulex]XP_046462725.1 CUB and sushi domain-containing protein 2-like isoform X2 [Daphnia pulex]